MYQGEINFDGLIGPTHNYSGLSEGNIASFNNSKKTSSPLNAALQGLEKMKLLIDLGIPQGIFLPHERPNLNFLRSHGFLGSDTEIVASAAKNSNLLLNQSYSASSMWAANAATFSPSIDSQDSIAHITPANLFSMPHRRIEAEFTYQQLNIIFNRSHFKIHKPINPSDLMGDEGAANHLRITNHHLDKGIQIFVYGRDSFQESLNVVARQSKAASEYIANSHKLDMEQTFFLKQNMKAINSGSFHNDIVSLSTENVFIFHEEAFNDSKNEIQKIRSAFKAEDECFFIEILKNDIPLDILVNSYLLNSQLVRNSSGDMTFIMPTEVKNYSECTEWLARIKENSPIKDFKYIDIKQSMMNGGGPACLRFKIVVNENEFNNINPNFLLTPVLIKKLESLIKNSYRDTLEIRDLADPELINESYTILDNLTQIFKTGSIYNFQKE
jgi:succinylarginine dihydrolase